MQPSYSVPPSRQLFYSFDLLSNNNLTESITISSNCQSEPPADVLFEDFCNDSSKYIFTNQKLRVVIKVFEDEKLVDMSFSSECMKKLYESMDHSDLIIKSSSGEEFKAHRWIITARSPVLDRMFSEEMKENLSGVFEIDDSSEVVKTLIRFIYFGDSHNEFDDITAIDINLYDAAERYEIQELKIVCLRSIFKRLSVGNVLEIVGFAKTFNLKRLYSCCLLMIFA